MKRADLRSGLKFVVGTHHKTGSKFFSKALKTLKRLTGLRVWVDTKHNQRELRLPERWAHKPQQEFSDLTYAEKLTSLSCLDDQICFEIEHVAGRTIRRMLEVNADPRFLHVDLDRISSDPEMEELKACHSFCGLQRWFPLDTWLEACRPHCLWAMQTLEQFGPRARAGFRSAFGDPLFQRVFD